MGSSAVSDEHTKLLEQCEHLLSAGSFGEALRLASQAKAHRSDSPRADTIRARCFKAMGDDASAHQAALEAIRHDPNHAPARELLGTTQGSTSTPDDPIISSVLANTMLGAERLKNLSSLVDAVAKQGIAGAIVECGVAGGGSLALLAMCANRAGISDRAIYGFDSFSGMPAPQPEDTASSIPANESGWGAGTCAAPRRAVEAVLTELSVRDRVELVEGQFEHTLHEFAEELKAQGKRIALLHADGDWYSSTRAILTSLAPCLSPGALVQIDDYGHWDGCRLAVDEYLARHAPAVTLHQIDYTGRWLQWPSTS